MLAEMVLYSPDYSMCWKIYIIRSVSVQVSTTCVEAILLTRVHALYNCSYRSRLILLTAFSVGTFLEISGSITAVANITPGPGGDFCNPQPSGPLSIILFSSGWWMVQLTSILMTASQIYFSRKPGRVMRTPLVSLMLSDGLSVFLSLAVVTVGVATFEVLRRYMSFSVAYGNLVWNAAYAWYMALLSIIGCRIILRMRRLASQHLRDRLPSNESTLYSFTELPSIIYSDSED
ncbi:hypothetical protein CPB84DRAFT_1793823 [Gymnopilus junonius]|uniref:Uncharacterized protein n=1 Tax=Gymnopilus junonius TaxID=109634 RepID=A0A9P5NBH9_GYMJU|nr:hypothetical protein CPB84DRAFT_1793823 [Gymnopilus junonius]